MARRVISAAEALSWDSALDTPATAVAAPFFRPSTSLWVRASVARARSRAISYGRGSIRNSSSPSCTCWLSRTCSSTIYPVTCEAIPTKLARTVASSVCGRACHWSTATTTTTAVPTTMPVPSSRPTRRRTTRPDELCVSAIALAPEESPPEHERHEKGQTRVYQRWRADIRMESRPDKEPPSEQRRPNPDHRAEHPGREKRPDNVDLWSHHHLLMPPSISPKHLLGPRVQRPDVSWTTAPAATPPC